MSNDIKDVVIPILRTLQSDMKILKESVRRTDARISAVFRAQLRLREPPAVVPNIVAFGQAKPPRLRSRPD